MAKRTEYYLEGYRNDDPTWTLKIFAVEETFSGITELSVMGYTFWHDELTYLETQVHKGHIDINTFYEMLPEFYETQLYVFPNQPEKINEFLYDGIETQLNVQFNINDFDKKEIAKKLIKNFFESINNTLPVEVLANIAKREGESNAFNRKTLFNRKK